MCGITGFIDGHLRKEESESIIRAMTDTLRHRGPDGEGYWSEDNTGLHLGHRRLAILDLSEAGKQPMMSGSQRYVVTYNGEIYNAPELRDELIDIGHRFKGHCDTEVLVEALDRWGLGNTLTRLSGMFAMAVFDREERSLHLVRDRFGKKPLYYGWTPERLIFGSELKALRANPRLHVTLDPDAIGMYFRYLCVPSPWSIYKEVSKVPPASVVTFDATELKREPRVTEFWSAREEFNRSDKAAFSGNLDEAVEALSAVLKAAVSKRMIADVPLGAFLSGGIDSSLVVALMQEASERPVKTFTVGFEDPALNEAEYAKAIAHHLGTDHTEIYVTSKEALDVVPSLPTMYDEPFADSSQIPTYLISKLARSQLKVALSGDGGDELFGGYNRHLIAHRYFRTIGRTPAGVRRLLGRSALAIPEAAWDRALRALPFLGPKGVRSGDVGYKAHKFARVLSSSDSASLHLSLASVWKDPSELVHGWKNPPDPLQENDKWPSAADPVKRMMFLDAMTYLPNDVLAKVDRASMATSLEVRNPFLDPEVASLAWSFPRRLNFSRNQGKLVPRHVLVRYLMPEHIDRPKQGFGVPLAAWLRGPLRGWGEEMLGSKRLAAFVDSKGAMEAWTSHQSRKRNLEHHLWALLMLSAWLSTNGH